MSEDQASFLFAMLAQLKKAAFTLWGEDLRLIYMSPAACEWAGIRLENAVEKHFLEIFQAPTEAYQLLQRVLEEERSFPEIQHLERTHPVTGEIQNWKIDYYFLHLPDGRKGVGTRAFNVTTEINAQRQLEHEKQNLFAVLQKIPAACSLTALDENGRMFIAMSNATNDLWAGKGPLTGRYCDELFPELKDQDITVEGETTNAFASIQQVFETKRAFSLEAAPFIILNKEGVPQNLVLNSRTEPLFDTKGRVCYVLVFSVDVTKEAQARRELEEAKKALEAAVRVRDDFISVASHELRTPISTVMLVAEGIPRVTAIVQDEGVKKRLSRFQASLSRQASRLTELVDDMLAVSSGNTELTHPTTFDLSNLVRETVVKLGDAADQARCKLELSMALAIGTWDACCVAQIITNFLSNAIKYGAGHPIQVRTFQKGGMMTVLTVRDFGPGVKEEDQDRIFRKFERAVPVGAYAGLGLGLWIASRAAHQIGASLKVRTPEDGRGGAQFELYLPNGELNE